MTPQILLFTPPFTQLNTPYPATAYLKGFLNTKEINSHQADLGIEVILKLFCERGLSHVFHTAQKKNTANSPNAVRILSLGQHYLRTIDPVIAFLQGENPALALQIATRDYLPEASRFQTTDELEWAFGIMGTQDLAKHLATLYLEDLSDFIVETVDENFGFSRYAERLGRSANSFDEIYARLQQPLSFVDEYTIAALSEKLLPQDILAVISVPFPGNLFSAFRCAQWIKQHRPGVRIAMGGGFPNTELRSLSDVRVFEFFDFVCLDDGELPLEQLWRSVLNNEQGELKRTFAKRDGAVVYRNECVRSDYKMRDTGTPDYLGLPLSEYISVIEIANPMHRLWSDGRWNKLTMAHGCYWGKCTFCDISLDYIKVYEPVAAALLCDRVQTLIETTGQSGFHFVDEAAPPALMREFALEVIRRNLQITWWTNIRFEKSFTADLCRLLRASGCVAVSGGLEVASDRLLALIDKGVTVSQVAQVTQNFTQSGIMVHAYLMYGFPTQTVQETVDSLEMVRQLFESGALQSGFWHQFAMTAHSPIGLMPDEFKVIKTPNSGGFADNDVAFSDPTGVDHNRFSYGLRKSLYNFMHGIGFDFPLQQWFDFKIPKTAVAPDYIAQALNVGADVAVKYTAKVAFIGAMPEVQFHRVTKKGLVFENATLTIHTKTATFDIGLPAAEARWLVETLPALVPETGKPLTTLGALKNSFESSGREHFELFFTSKAVQKLRRAGWLVL